MKRPKEVKVIWRDAQDCGISWGTKEECLKFAGLDMINETKGFLVGRRGKFICVARDWSADNENFGGIIKIPLTMVVKIV